MQKDAIKGLIDMCENENFLKTINNIKEEDNSIHEFKRIKDDFLEEEIK